MTGFPLFFLTQSFVLFLFTSNKNVSKIHIEDFVLIVTDDVYAQCEEKHRVSKTVIKILNLTGF